MAERIRVVRGAELPPGVGEQRLVLQSGQPLPINAVLVERAAMQRFGDDLVIVLPNGLAVQVVGHFASVEPARLSLADGAVVTVPPLQTAGAELFASIEPAAGPGGPSATDAAARTRGGLLGNSPVDPLSVLLGDIAGDRLGGRDYRGLSRDEPHAVDFSNIGSISGTVQSGVGGIERPSALPREFVRNETPQVTALPAPAPQQLPPPAPVQQQPAIGPSGVPTPDDLSARDIAFSGSVTFFGSFNSSFVDNRLFAGSVLGSSISGSIFTRFGIGFGGPDPAFARLTLSADAGGPGNGSPPLLRSPDTGTSGNDLFDATAVGTFDTTQFDPVTHSFMIDGTAIAASDVMNFIFSFGGIDFLVPPSSLSIETTLAARFAADWSDRPVSDAYAGLAGNDTLLGGSGQDLLQGDFQLGASSFFFGSFFVLEPPPPGNDSIDGGSGADTLYGGGGSDTLLGGAGDDLIIVTDLDFAVLDGGFGGEFPGNTIIDPVTGQPFFPGQPGNVTHAFDTLSVLATGVTLDLGQNGLAGKIKNVEGIDLAFGGSNTFRATAAQIDAITNEDADASGTLDAADDLTIAADDVTDTLFVTGSGDAVQLTGGGWSKVAAGINGSTLEVNAANLFFDKYTNPGGVDGVGDMVTVYVQTTVQVALS
jgi:hypothetical protein